MKKSPWLVIVSVAFTSLVSHATETHLIVGAKAEALVAAMTGAGVATLELAAGFHVRQHNTRARDVSCSTTAMPRFGFVTSCSLVDSESGESLAVNGPAASALYRAMSHAGVPVLNQGLEGSAVDAVSVRCTRSESATVASVVTCRIEY